MNLIEPASISLHCDACGYDSDPITDNPRNHIGEQCPKCSIVMITEADCDAMDGIEDGLARLNAILIAAAEGAGVDLAEMIRKSKASPSKLPRLSIKTSGEITLKFPKGD